MWRSQSAPFNTVSWGRFYKLVSSISSYLLAVHLSQMEVFRPTHPFNAQALLGKTSYSQQVGDSSLQPCMERVQRRKHASRGAWCQRRQKLCLIFWHPLSHLTTLSPHSSNPSATGILGSVIDPHFPRVCRNRLSFLF